jgi:hypothetical protein
VEKLELAQEEEALNDLLTDQSLIDDPNLYEAVMEELRRLRADSNRLN